MRPSYCPMHTYASRTHIHVKYRQIGQKMINLILAWLNTLDMPLDSTFPSIATWVRARSCPRSTPPTLTSAHRHTEIIFLSPEHDDFYSQYECSYSKSTNFYHFSFDDHQLSHTPHTHVRATRNPHPPRSYLSEWVNMAMTLQDINRRTHQHKSVYSITRPKTSKLINSETKVEHARKINIKKVAEAPSYTFIFIYYVWNEY